VLDRTQLSVYPEEAVASLALHKPPQMDPVAVFALRDIQSVCQSSRGPCVWKVNTAQEKGLFTMPDAAMAAEWIADVQLYVDVLHGRALVPAPGLANGPELDVEGPSWGQRHWQSFTAVLPDFVARMCEVLESCDEYHDPDTTNEVSAKQGNEDETQTGSNFTLALRFIVAVQGAALTYSSAFVYALLVLNHAINGGIVTMIFPVISFLWAIPRQRRLPQWWWQAIISYTLLLVSMQYLLKLPAFCNNETMYALAGHCSGLSDTNTKYLTTPYLVGIRSGSSFLSIAWVDVTILLATGIHILRLQYTGRWDEDEEELHASGESQGFMKEHHVDLPPGVTEEEYHSAGAMIRRRDFYTYVFFADTAALFWTMFFYSHMTNSTGSLADAITANNLDWGFVSSLVIQFLVLVFDRVLYLTKANEMKSYLHTILILLYHIIMLLVLQMQSGNPGLSMLYVLKCAYFGFSAMQVRDQYPLYTQGEYLTRTTEGEEPSLMQYYLYTAYRACPFMYELRVLLDWACCLTSLDFYQWFKFQDIHGQLFMTRCYIAQRKAALEENDGNHGAAQSLVSKFGVGVWGFVFLCTLLFLPLVLFSSGSILMVENPVRSASMTISLTDGSKSFKLYDVSGGIGRGVQTKDLSVMNRQQILRPYFEKSGTQLVRFPATSDKVFAPPPPVITQMVNKLKDPNVTMSVVVKTVVERDLPLENRDPLFSTMVDLSNADQAKLAKLVDSVVSSKVGVKSSCVIQDIVPDVMLFPASAKPRVLGGRRHGLLFTLHRAAQNNGMWDQWWDIQEKAPKKSAGHIEVFAVSSEVMGSYMGIGSTVSQLGVVGLYVSVVFVVGRVLRGYVANLQSRVMFEDMEDVTVPLFLCRSVVLAREEAGTAFDNEHGDIKIANALELENHLYWELIRLYRQPEKLFRYTTANVAPESETLLTSYKSDR